MKKTLLITLSWWAPIRNFLFVPNGVMERLMTKGEFKIVLAVRDTLFDQYRQELESLEEVGVEIIKVKTAFPEGIFRKVFTFFYSFLTFTETTKLVSTKGTRADISISLGQKLSYVLKKMINMIFGDWYWLKKHFIGWIFLNIGNSRPYQEIFDKYKPDLVFVANIQNFFDLGFLAEAKLGNIKTVGMIASWDHLNKYFIPLRADKFLAWNEIVAKEAIKYGMYDEGQIEVVGFPQFDAYFNRSIIVSKEDFLKKIGADADKKIIFFVSEGVYNLAGGEVAERLADRISRNETAHPCHLVLRPYQGNPGEDGRYGGLRHHDAVYYNDTDNWSKRENFFDFINFLFYADIVISTYSSLAVEASVFSKPQINLAFDGDMKLPPNKSVNRLKNLSHFSHILNSGGTISVNSYDELFSVVDKFLTDPNFNSTARNNLTNTMCWRLDGLASERIVNSLVVD